METAEREDTGQFLTFKVADEVYGADVSQVREVLELVDITRVPRMPDFMRGVINLRGGVVPVIDLGLKFGLEKIQETVNTCIIVLELAMGGEQTVIGALADSVREVINLEQEQIEGAPKIGMTLDSAFIRGIGKRDEEFIIILDIDRIFSTADLSALQGSRLGGEGEASSAPEADDV